MNCLEFESNLETVIERHESELPPDAAAHLDQCDSCSSLWDDYVLLQTAISAWRPVNVPDLLMSRTLQILIDDARSVGAAKPTTTITLKPNTERLTQDRSRRESFAGRLVIAATAGCLLLAGLTAIRTGNELDQYPLKVSKKIQTLRPLANSAQVASSGEVSRSVAALIDDLRTEYSQLASETSASARDLAAVIHTPVIWSELSFAPVSSDMRERQASITRLPPAPQPETKGSHTEQHSSSRLAQVLGGQLEHAIGFLWNSVPESRPAG